MTRKLKLLLIALLLTPGALLCATPPGNGPGTARSVSCCCRPTSAGDTAIIHGELIADSSGKVYCNVPAGQKLAAVVSPAAGINNSLLVQLFKKFWYLPIAFVLFATLVYFFVRSQLQTVRRREREKSLLQRQLMQSEMKALRSQMNPHFIFNAINSIQHYVLTNEKELANKYLVKFSKLMRNILDLSKEELIPLRDELDTVRLYLEIEALRFNNAFRFAVDCSPTIDQDLLMLPPLLIQPFVENAIWHGLLLKEGEKELRISVSRNADHTEITIDDNGIGRAAAEKFRNSEFSRKSLGMEITGNRLEALRKTHRIGISYDVFDKVAGNGDPLGTTVKIKLTQVSI